MKKAGILQEINFHLWNKGAIPDSASVHEKREILSEIGGTKQEVDASRMGVLDVVLTDFLHFSSLLPLRCFTNLKSYFHAIVPSCHFAILFFGFHLRFYLFTRIRLAIV